MKLLRNIACVASLVACLTGLGGCGSPSVKPQVIDQPLAALLREAAAGMAPCLDPASKDIDSEPKGARSLKEERKCWFIVQSEGHFDPEKKENSTGLDLKKNERYNIYVPPNQFWYDLDRISPAPQGDKGGWLIDNLVASLFKRHREYNWFALMAIADNTDENVQENKPMQIGPGCNILTGLDGRLRFYVNDASSKYGNNRGRILVIVERLANQTR